MEEYRRANQIDYLYKLYSESGQAIEVDFRSLVPTIVKPERYTHLIHPYPAKLLVNIPYYILKSGRFCPKGGIVLDPFCGTGTVMLEAMLNGCYSIGADANPIARLISEAKTFYIETESLEKTLVKIVRRASEDKGDRIPDFPNKDYWFSQHVQKQLSHLLYAIRKVKDRHARVFFMVCFSNIVKKVSYADPRIYVPVKLNPDKFSDKPDLYQKLRIKFDSLREVDVYAKFEQISRENIQRMKTLRGMVDNNFAAQVVSKDARKLTKRIGTKDLMEAESVDLVLTSPPYAGAQKYIRSSRLSLDWFGMGDAESIRNLEKCNIGREDFAIKDKNVAETGIKEADDLIVKIGMKDKTRACIVSTYLNEMREALKECKRPNLGPGLIWLR